LLGFPLFDHNQIRLIKFSQSEQLCSSSCFSAFPAGIPSGSQRLTAEHRLSGKRATLQRGWGWTGVRDGRRRNAAGWVEVL